MVKQFFDYLNQTSLLSKEKESIKAIFDHLDGNYLNMFANRSFLIEGEPGIGKTFLIKKLVRALNKKTLYLGQSDFQGDNVERVLDLDALLEKLENFEEGIVYIDDIKFLFDFTEFDELDNVHRKKMMNIMEFFRDNDKKTVLILTLNDSSFLEESQRDRIDIKINLDLPTTETKINYLKDVFGECVDEEPLIYLSKNSLGYSYRDLPSVLKLAYFHGNRKVSRDSLIRALREYKPSGLSGYNLKQGVELRIRDLLLNDSLREKLEKVITIVKKQDQLKELGVSRSKFLIFEGPAGVGKTHTTMALAGELGLPIVKVGAENCLRPGALFNLFSSIERFGKAIFLLDDSDKFFGGRSMDIDDGGPMFADLNKLLDSLEDKGAIIIMSANDTRRFGTALRDRFDIIKFDFPEERERMHFFKNLMRKSKIRFKVSERELATMNSNKGFRGMQRFWNECIFYAVHNDKKIITQSDLGAIFRDKENELNGGSMFG